jgi:thiol:disulfide interchange protein DsbA
MKTLKYFTASTRNLISVVTISLTMLLFHVDTSAQTLSEKHYKVLANPMTVSTGHNIEVMYLFWYGSQHCYALEPHLKTWLTNSRPAKAQFTKVPAIYSQEWSFYAKAFYTMQTLGVLGQTHDSYFHKIIVEKKPMNNLDSLIKFLSTYNKSAEEVTSAINSFAVDSKFRNASLITKRSTTAGVPAIIVDGKYLTSVKLAGSK